MRVLIAFGLYVSLTNAGFGQEVREKPGTEEKLQERQIAQYLKAGDYNAAEASLRHRLADQSSDAATANDLRVALADLLRETGKEIEARELFRIAMKAPDLTWRQRLAAAMGIADIDGRTISPQAGSGLWMQAIALAREHQDEDPTREAEALRGLANMWLEAGEPSRAEPLLRRSLKVLEAAPSAGNWQIAATLGTTGQVYRAQDKLALAEDAWTRALDLERNAFGESHPQVASLKERLAEIYAVRKQFDLARQFAGQAVSVMRSSCGEDSLAAAAAFANRGLVEERANALPAAAEDYATALTIARKHPANPTIAIRIMQSYMAVLRAIHHDREARALALELKSFRRQNLR